MKTVAYLRVSSSQQDIDSQKLALMEYAHREKLVIDQFIQVEISSRKIKQHTDLKALITVMESGDLLLVSELSRIGRSVAQIIMTIDQLIRQGVRFIAIKENIHINGQHDLQSKMLVTMFGLLAELERDLISRRTKEGLVNAKAKGKKLGRPKGKKSKSKLDGQEAQIVEWMDKKISRASIARLLGVAPSTLHQFVKERNLEAGSILKEMGK